MTEIQMDTKNILRYLNTTSIQNKPFKHACDIYNRKRPDARDPQAVNVVTLAAQQLASLTSDN